MAQLAKVYIERYAKVQKRSWKTDERVLGKDVIPRWGPIKAKDITRRDVVALIDDVMDRKAPIMANRVFAIVRKMFNYALERSILETSPCVAVKAPGRERQRDRVLSEEEIRKFWNALDRLNVSFAIRCALKLQLITAQRKGEIIRAEWSEINNDWWTIPAEKAKNELAHRVPLSALAQTVLGKVPRLDDRFLFPSRSGNKPIVDTSVDHAIRKHADAFGIANFTPHDLRRTAASHMAGMGISRLVLSKILNHVEAGITAVYDRHSYDGEKRVALDAWGRKLETIIHGATSNVVALTRPSA